jgi:TRAP-type C4-dicarboxylate transport system permease small subunit
LIFSELFCGLIGESAGTVKYEYRRSPQQAAAAESWEGQLQPDLFLQKQEDINMSASPKNFFDYVYKAGEILAAVAFISLCVSVSVQVIARYIFNHAFGWGEEFPIFIFLWVSFLAAAVAYRDGDHLSVDFIVEKYPPKVRRVVHYITLLLSLAFVLLIVYFEGRMTWATRTSTFVVMKISKAFCYIGIPASGLLLAVFIIEKLMKTYHKSPKKRQEDSGKS